MSTESARATNGGGHAHHIIGRAPLLMKFPDIGKGGEIKATTANAYAAIKLLNIECSRDAFHDRLLVGGQAIAQYAGELSDNACLYIRKLIHDAFEFDPGRNHTLDAAVQLCLENQFDPVVDYINGLQWDGTKRINKWLTTYLGAPDSVLNCAIGIIALVAQIRRARQPGCKFDQIIVLESPEGKLKSTALNVLAGGEAFFSDQTILGKGDKEQQELLRGVWVYEIAELSNSTRSEVESVKAFASRTHDRARPAYGRCVVEQPRRAVIWATTNDDHYLKSQTGNRRFWPIRAAETRPIDIEALKRDRDQLLAEAAVMEAKGAPIVLPAGLWSDASEEQEQRREIDPWEDLVSDIPGLLVDGEWRIFSNEILKDILEVPADRQTTMHFTRLGKCMRRHGWNGPKMLRIGNKQRRGFWKKG
jgi:predicted P-loop ATPase